MEDREENILGGTELFGFMFLTMLIGGFYLTWPKLKPFKLVTVDDNGLKDGGDSNCNLCID